VLGGTITSHNFTVLEWLQMSHSFKRDVKFTDGYVKLVLSFISGNNNVDLTKC